MCDFFCTFAHFSCAKAKQETMSKPIDILQTIARYRELGIEEQAAYSLSSKSYLTDAIIG